jgi:hypothetical protein
MSICETVVAVLGGATTLLVFDFAVAVVEDENGGDAGAGVLLMASGTRESPV